jgi:hypothetical protein
MDLTDNNGHTTLQLAGIIQSGGKVDVTDNNGNKPFLFGCFVTF